MNWPGAAVLSATRPRAAVLSATRLRAALRPRAIR